MDYVGINLEVIKKIQFLINKKKIITKKYKIRFFRHGPNNKTNETNFDGETNYLVGFFMEKKILKKR